MASTLPMAAVSAALHPLATRTADMVPRSSPETSMAAPDDCKQRKTDITCAQQDDRLVSSLDLVSLPRLTSCRVAVVFAIQSWLAESPEQKRTSTTPAYFQVGMSGKSGSLDEVETSTNGVAAMSLLVVGPTAKARTIG